MGTLVFCDIEGTLIDGSLTHSFVQAGRRMRVFAPGRLALAQGYALLSVVAPKRYAPSLRWRALLQLLAGQRRDEIERVGRAGMPELRAIFKPAIVDRLAAHKAAGDTVVMLSGGLHEAARLVAEEVGADAGEGTRAEVRDGIYTGRLDEMIGQGKMKARRAAALARTHGVRLAESVAYGDSAADIPLLAAVGHAVAVDPDAKLRSVAEARGWEIIDTKSKNGRGGRRSRVVPDAQIEAPLLDQTLPDYDVASRHSVIVRAPAATVYEAITRIEPGRAPLVRTLMGVRSLPALALQRGARRMAAAATPDQDARAALWRRFLILAEQPGQERVVGLAGQFWRPAGNIARLRDAAAWQAYSAPGTAKAAMTLRVEPLDHQTARVYTETRVQTYGRQARRLFRAYWLVIGPFGGLLRRSLLRQVKRNAEQSAGVFVLTP